MEDGRGVPAHVLRPLERAGTRGQHPGGGLEGRLTEAGRKDEGDGGPGRRLGCRGGERHDEVTPHLPWLSESGPAEQVADAGSVVMGSVEVQPHALGADGHGA